jgi:HSP20 family protein
MSLIPFRMKRATGMEPTSLTTLADFRNEMNRLFEGFFSRPLEPLPAWFPPAVGLGGPWLPAIDVSETDTLVRVRCELPGVDPKDVDVSVSEDRLVISGEKKASSETTTDGMTHRESHYGAFNRAIPLPEAVDPAKVSAAYDKGVLVVEMTKSPSGTSRKIPVQTA